MQIRNEAYGFFPFAKGIDHERNEINSYIWFSHKKQNAHIYLIWLF